MTRLLAVCLVGFILAGCATVPMQVRLAAFASHQARISELSAWSFEGRAGIHTARDGGSVTIRWRQVGDHYRIALVAPFGAGAIRLTGNPHRVRLQTSGGVSAVADSARALLNRYMGYDLPVASLRYWLRGIPAPGAVQRRQLDSQGRLTFLVQQGWQIKFYDYGYFAGLALPTTLELHRGQVEVRLVIRDWDVSA